MNYENFSTRLGHLGRALGTKVGHGNRALMHYGTRAPQKQVHSHLWLWCVYENNQAILSVDYLPVNTQYRSMFFRDGE